MKIRDLILTEAPLPDDWDKDIYNERIPFAQRVRYAKERADQLGVGSSRVAFNIRYKGRETALKVAKNRKGMAQNRAEAELLDDWYIAKTGLFIPLIDYDERNSMPTWLHTEKADKISRAQLKRYLGGSNIENVIFSLIMAYERNEWAALDMLPDRTKETDLFNSLQDIAGNYSQIQLGDFSRKANWGLYKGEPVIIDLGFTQEVAKEFYR